MPSPSKSSSKNALQEQSRFEKMFSTQATFSRNKRYIDILKIKQDQNLHQIKRRKPATQHKKVDNTIINAFSSAKKQLNLKLDDDIERFKFRMSFTTDFMQSQQQRSPSRSLSPSESNPKSPRIKGIPMHKISSRQNFQKLKKPCQDERLFNNFKLNKGDLSKVPGIGNYTQRSLNFANANINDLNYNSQKKYEEVYFNNATTSCIFNLKVQKDNRGRYFFPKRKPQDNPSTDLNPESVRRSFNLATPFHPNKISHFYKESGRELPSQFDERYNSPNKHFYKDPNGRLIKSKPNFVVKKYKEDLLERDLLQIRKSKKPYFQRDQICDQKYFKQQQKIELTKVEG